MEFTEIGVIVDAVSIMVLVVFNIIVVWHNRKTLLEMEKTRKSEFLSRIKVGFYYLNTKTVFLKIVNAGKGPITNVTLDINMIPIDGYDKNAFKILNWVWTNNLMTSHESHIFHMQFFDMKTISESISEIKITGTFIDIFNEPQTVEETVSIEELKQHMENRSYEVVDRFNVVSGLNQIEKEFSSLNKNIKDFCETIKLKEIIEEYDSANLKK